MAKRKQRDPERQEREREEDEEAHTEEAILIALVVLLLAGLPPVALAERIVGLLVKAGIAAGAAAAVLGLIGAGGLVFAGVVGSGADVGAAEAMIRRTSPTRRARYILAAAKRLAAGGSPTAERALYRAHLAAEDRRLEGARKIDLAGRRWGPLLGWYSIRDGRTTMECWAAHGGNFSALRPPSIGWPGTLHGGNCRCGPGPPWPEGTMLL